MKTINMRRRDHLLIAHLWKVEEMDTHDIASELRHETGEDWREADVYNLLPAVRCSLSQ